MAIEPRPSQPGPPYPPIEPVKRGTGNWPLWTVLLLLLLFGIGWAATREQATNANERLDARDTQHVPPVDSVH